MDILFVAGFAPIVPNPVEGASFYRDTLGLPLQVVSGDYLAVDGFDGSKHLGIWPLVDAAQSCFGSPVWPDHIPVPQATIEFEVADVDEAVAELRAQGHTLIHDPRVEPWGKQLRAFWAWKVSSSGSVSRPSCTDSLLPHFSHGLERR